jgi:putative FmdB family regulatory protein
MVARMPTYEYRCPQGHTFELFQRMSDDPPESCEVCGESPVERLLFAPPIHFKGSGFYSTDYGRRGRKRDAAGSGEGSGSEPAKSDEKKGASSSESGTKSESGKTSSPPSGSD